MGGGGRGAEGVCEIDGGGGSRYGGEAIKAVVQLPADAIDGLRSRTGEQATFEGTLLSCDAFMRNLFVAGGLVVN